jgi:hypothetical protein
MNARHKKAISVAMKKVWRRRRRQEAARIRRKK